MWTESDSTAPCWLELRGKIEECNFPFGHKHLAAIRKASHSSGFLLLLLTQICLEFALTASLTLNTVLHIELQVDADETSVKQNHCARSLSLRSMKPHSVIRTVFLLQVTWRLSYWPCQKYTFCGQTSPSSPRTQEWTSRTGILSSKANQTWTLRDTI